MTKRFGLRSLAPRQGTAAMVREADRICLAQVEQAKAAVRPSQLGIAYVQKEFAARGDEQEQIWAAEGEHAARPHQVRARGLDSLVEATGFLLSEGEAEVRQAHAEHQRAVRVLAPLVRREPFAKLRYLVGFLVLWLGDAAGILNTAVTHGEIPAIALGQALACGLAVASSGLVGNELRHHQLRRSRRRDGGSLTEDETAYRHLFTGEDRSLGVVKLVALLSVVVTVLVGLGIYFLRTGVEGEAAGITFGLLAVGTALGSLLLGYASADEVADLLARSETRARQAEKRHLSRVFASPMQERAKADETARLILLEHQRRGSAARFWVESLAWRVLRNNPHVFGHGYPNVGHCIVGRRLRRDHR